MGLRRHLQVSPSYPLHPLVPLDLFLKIIYMHNFSCIDDHISIGRVGIRASVKRMIRRGAASLILEVVLGWSLVRLRLGLCLGTGYFKARHWLEPS